jgi:hypothetical protein
MAAVAQRRLLPAAVATATQAVLVVAIAVATAGAAVAGGWVDGAGGVILVAAVGAVEAAILARSPLSRGVTALLTVPLAVSAIVPLTAAAMPDDGIAGAGHVVVRYVDAAFTGLMSPDDWPFIVGLATVMWLCSFWSGWVLMRERRGVVAVAPMLVVLGVNALNAPTLQHVAPYEMTSLTAMVLAVGAAELSHLDDGWRWRAVPTLPRLRRRFAVAVVGGSMVVLVAGLLLPPLSTTDLTGRIFSGPRGNGSGGGGGGSGGAGGTVSFSPSTQPGGPLHVDPHPVLRYTTDRPVGVYLRAVNDTVFDRGDWFPDGANGAAADPAPFHSGPLPRDRDPSHGGVGTATAPIHLHISDFFTAPTGGTTYGLFAGEPDAIAHDGTIVGLDADGSGTRFLVVDEVGLNVAPDRLGSLDSTATLPVATVGQLRSAGRDYPDFLDSFTDLGDDERGQLSVIHSLAVQWTAGTTNPYDAASAIESHLRDTNVFHYTLTPPAVPKDRWPIVYFLTSGHRGYCQYFASSMGTMLRSLGIPARLVNGYGPGSSEEQSGPGRTNIGHQVSTSDAHTWVEAYFPNYGWIPFEPTPPSDEGDYRPLPRGPVAVDPTPGPTPGATRSPGPVTSPTPAPGSTGPSRPGAGPSVWARALAGGGLALVVAGLVTGLGLRWWRRPGSLAAAWRRLGVAGRLAGVRRGPGETRAGYARRLAATLDPGGGAAPALATVAAACGKAEFSRSALDDGDTAAWRHAWRSVSTPLLRAALRRARSIVRGLR